MLKWLEKNAIPVAIITLVTLAAPQIGVAILLVLGGKWLMRNG